MGEARVTRLCHEIMRELLTTITFNIFLRKKQNSYKKGRFEMGGLILVYRGTAQHAPLLAGSW